MSMAAQYKAEALVLGVHNWGEADKMVTLFTRERGKVKAAAFGSRRPKSSLAAGMQMFQHVEVHMTEGRRLDTVRQCALLHRYRKLGEDLTAMAYGSFVAEILREFLPENAVEPKAFDLMLEIFQAFETRNPRVTALAAAWQLLAHFGLQLRLDRCVHCGKEIDGDAFLHIGEGGVLCNACSIPDARAFPAGGRAFLHELLELDWKQPRLKVQRENLLMAEQTLLAYLQGMLGKPLRSLDFIRQLV